MPQCTGCSKFYKFLEGDRCDTCSDSAPEPKPRADWPLCSHCGKRFEFIDCTKPCILCQERNSQDALSMPPPPSQPPVRQSTPSAGHEDIHYAMTHPTNARTHSARDSPIYRNPLQSYNNHRNCNENDVSTHFEYARTSQDLSIFHLASLPTGTRGIQRLPKWVRRCDFSCESRGTSCKAQNPRD